MTGKEKSGWILWYNLNHVITGGSTLTKKKRGAESPGIDKTSLDQSIKYLTGVKLKQITKKY